LAFNGCSDLYSDFQALALLDKILRYDEKTRADITRFLDDRGYLRALVDFENVGNKTNIAQILTAPDGKRRNLFSTHTHVVNRLASGVIVVFWEIAIFATHCPNSRRRKLVVVQFPVR
jgi:hypothetical protein